MKPIRTRAESKDLIRQIEAIIHYADIEVKRIASDIGTSVTYVHNIIRQFGYRQMLVSPEERRAILASRQARKTVLKAS